MVNGWSYGPSLTNPEMQTVIYPSNPGEEGDSE